MEIKGVLFVIPDIIVIMSLLLSPFNHNHQHHHYYHYLYVFYKSNTSYENIEVLLNLLRPLSVKSLPKACVTLAR